MSVNALKPTLSAIRADGDINLEEIKVLIDPNKGLGVNTDTDEFEIFRRLATDIKVGNLKNVTPETVKEVNDNNKKRLVHKGVKIGAIVGGVLGVAALIATPILLGPLFYVAPAVAMAVLGLTVGIGALAGFIRSRTTPITKGEIKRQSPLAVAATRFKKNPLVQRGVKIGGAIGGTIGGVGAVGVVTTAAAAFILGAGAAGGAGPVLLVAASALGILGAGVALLIGIGALGGYIHSKIKGSRDKDIPTGPVTADAEAAALLEQTINKGVTTKDYVKKGTKIGGIVAGVIGGLGIGGWSAGALISAGIASVGAVGAGGMGLLVAAYTFFPVAGIVLAVAALSVGIGALAGFIHSKVKKQKD